MLKKPMTTEELFDKIKGILQEKDKLPDGAWDNSFGTRNYKWSYRGSRTSDGCAAGYGLADDPVLQEAFRRNTQLLERCTQDGLLYGGDIFAAAGEPPCVHHTFGHARGLAVFLNKSGRKGRQNVHYAKSRQKNGLKQGRWIVLECV